MQIWEKTLSIENLREISKKFETALRELPEDWVKMKYEKREVKISWHCPFKYRSNATARVGEGGIISKSKSTKTMINVCHQHGKEGNREVKGGRGREDGDWGARKIWDGKELTFPHADQYLPVNDRLKETERGYVLIPICNKQLKRARSSNNLWLYYSVLESYKEKDYEMFKRKMKKRHLRP
jgi:hypothetical protein